MLACSCRRPSLPVVCLLSRYPWSRKNGVDMVVAAKVHSSIEYACAGRVLWRSETAWRMVVVAVVSVESATVSGRRASLPRSFPLDSGSRLPSNDTTVPTSDLPSTCLDCAV